MCFKVPVLLAHPDLLRIVPSARHNESAVAGQGKRIFRVVLEGINRTHSLIASYLSPLKFTETFYQNYENSFYSLWDLVRVRVQDPEALATAGSDWPVEKV
jgi:hypothetical protein